MARDWKQSSSKGGARRPLRGAELLGRPNNKATGDKSRGREVVLCQD